MANEIAGDVHGGLLLLERPVPVQFAAHPRRIVRIIGAGLLCALAVARANPASAGVKDDIAAADQLAHEARQALNDGEKCDLSKDGRSYSEVSSRLSAMKGTLNEWAEKRTNGTVNEQISAELREVRKLIDQTQTASADCQRLADLTKAASSLDAGAALVSVSSLLASPSWTASASLPIDARIRATCFKTLDSWLRGPGVDLNSATLEHPTGVRDALVRVRSCAGEGPPGIADAEALVDADSAVATLASEGRCVSDVLALFLDTYESRRATGRTALVSRLVAVCARYAESYVMNSPAKAIKSAADVARWRKVAATMARAETVAVMSHDASARVTDALDAREKELVAAANEVAAAERRYPGLLGPVVVEVSGAWTDGAAIDRIEKFRTGYADVARSFGLAGARFEVRGPDSRARFYNESYSVDVKATLLACRATSVTGYNPLVEGWKGSGPTGYSSLADKQRDWFDSLYWSIVTLGTGDKTTFAPKYVAVSLSNARGRTLRLWFLSSGKFSLSIDGVELFSQGGPAIPFDLADDWNAFFADLKPC